MKIAVDAMGGDHPPEAVVEGALPAEAAAPARLVPTGAEYRLRDLPGSALRSPFIRIIHAPEMVGMDEAGPVALRKNKSSLSVAMRLPAAGKHCPGSIPGLRRPAVAIPMPAPGGRALIPDGGAYHQADSIQLARCAILSGLYLKITEGLSQPRPGLLHSPDPKPPGDTAVVPAAFAWPAAELVNRQVYAKMADRERDSELFSRDQAACCFPDAGTIARPIGTRRQNQLVRC